MKFAEKNNYGVLDEKNGNQIHLKNLCILILFCSKKYCIGHIILPSTVAFFSSLKSSRQFRGNTGWQGKFQELLF